MALDRGDARRAAELVERVLRRAPADQRLDRAPALELLVRACASRGELERAASALEELREIEGVVGTEALRACADLAEATLRAAGGDHERARALLEDAIDGFERSRAPFEAATARLELATSLVALGHPEDAAREAELARDGLLTLGASVAAERAAATLAALGRAHLPLPELTRREREVLCLLAEGLTNREIAERLVISEHTVHRHVANILRKLELPSRTAAAARAVRSGLLELPTS